MKKQKVMQRPSTHPLPPANHCAATLPATAALERCPFPTFIAEHDVKWCGIFL